MAASRKFGAIAFGPQAALGTAKTTYQFMMTKMSGGINPVKDYGDLPRVGASMTRLGRFTQKARAEGTVRVLATPEALGLLLWQVFGNDKYTPGTPSSHVFTMGDAYPGYGFTVWDSVTSDATDLGTWWKYTDCFVTKLGLIGTSGENFAVEVSFVGFNYVPAGTPGTGAAPAASATTPVPIPATGTSPPVEPRFKFIGSTAKFSLEASPAATTYPNIENVTFEVDRAPEMRYGPSLTPTVIAPDRMVNMSGNMTYDSSYGSWDWLIDAMTNTITGTSPAAQNVGQASFEITAGKHPSSSTASLKIESNGYNWQFAATRPDAEATPGIAEVSLDGMVVAPDTTKGGSAVADTSKYNTKSTEATVTLLNSWAEEYGADS